MAAEVIRESVIFQVWTTLLGGTPQPSGPSTTAYDYTPVRSEWTRFPFTSGTCKTGDYGDPPELGEQRERGARLYCAARTAQEVQAYEAKQNGGETTMGSQAAFSLNVFGQQLDFLVTEPTVQLGASGQNGQSAGPNRYIGSGADGAQAFEIPMEFGTRFTPVRGLGLPGLAEVRYPVVLTTADTEAIDQNETGIGFDGYMFYDCGQNVTVSHADTIREASASTCVALGCGPNTNTENFELFSIGPATISMGFGLSMNVGAPSNPDARVLSSPPSGFNTNTRTGAIWTNGSGGYQYNDDPWYLGTLNGFFAIPDNAGGWPLPGSGPSYVRGMQNDDHLFKGSNSVSLTTALSGVLGVSFGPLTVGLDVQGAIAGTLSQDHIVQDAAIMEEAPGGTPMPATALTVRPHTAGAFTCGNNNGVPCFLVQLQFTLNGIPFVGSINWTVNVLSIGEQTLASYDSDSTHSWPESSAMRIGTWSTVATDSYVSTTEQPLVYSHLPQGIDFPSFADDDVDGCLADNTANTPPPPPCGAQPASGGPPKANMCAAVMPPNYSAGCTQIPAWAGAVAPVSAMNACTQTLLQWVCSGTGNKTGGPGVDDTHVMSSTDYATFGNDLASCLDAGGAAGADAAQLKAFAQNFQFVPCDANGNPQTISSVGASGSPPPVSAGGTCH